LIFNPIHSPSAVAYFSAMTVPLESFRRIEKSLSKNPVAPMIARTAPMLLPIHTGAHIIGPREKRNGHS